MKKLTMMKPNGEIWDTLKGSEFSSYRDACAHADVIAAETSLRCVVEWNGNRYDTKARQDHLAQALDSFAAGMAQALGGLR